MNDLVTEVSLLPEEIQEKIFQYYYSYLHKELLNEIKSVYHLERDIVNFINKDKKSLLYESNLEHYRKFNNLIKDITHNRGKMLLCKINNLKLRYSNLDYIHNICYDIKEDYKYIAPILISSDDINRYHIKHFLSSL